MSCADTGYAATSLLAKTSAVDRKVPVPACHLHSPLRSRPVLRPLRLLQADNLHRHGSKSSLPAVPYPC
eukprot:1194780-Rhodomonas_salina.3